MAYSDCWWTCGCAGKTVKSLENTCHTWALLRWWFTTKSRSIKCKHLSVCIWCWYLNTFIEYLNTWPLRTTIIQWKNALSLITVHTLGLYMTLWNYQKIKDTFLKKIMTAYLLTKPKWEKVFIECPRIDL